MGLKLCSLLVLMQMVRDFFFILPGWWTWDLICKRAVAEMGKVEFIFYVIIMVILTPTQLSLDVYSNSEYRSSYCSLSVPHRGVIDRVEARVAFKHGKACAVQRKHW